MADARIDNMIEAHEVLTRFGYDHGELHRGYTDRTLRIDISTNSIEIRPVTQQMKDLWIGGKGFDLWLMFQEINAQTKWDSPQNPISFSSGPLGGTTSFPGSGKTLVTAISPLTASVMDSNVGGHFGPFLKFAGFDALTIVGKAKDEIIIYIDAVNRKITIEKAPLESVDSHLLAEELTEMYADDEMDKRNIAVVSAGRGAEHIRMGLLNFSFWDWRRQTVRFKQAGRGGIGTVFRNKKIKAVVIKNKEIIRPWNIAENKVARQITSQICPSQKTDAPQVREIIAKWNNDPEYVIEAMQDIQGSQRYISKQAIEQLSLATGVSKAQLYHIATFYKAFSLKPIGRILIEVCVGTTCHVKGAAKILDSFERALGIERGETTQDGNFTLEAVACLGCCSIAPVVKVAGEIINNVKSRDVPRIIENALNRISRDDKEGRTCHV